MGIKITGIDTPFGGVSWEYTENAKRGIQELFFYLESKRLLINPTEMEIKSWCEHSAIEIKNKLVDLLAKYKFDDATITSFRLMIDACNIFLDELANVDNQGIIYKNKHGDWQDVTFSKAMKAFRRVYRDNIILLETAYRLKFNKDIPAE